MHSLRIAFSRNRLDSATFAGKNAFRRENPQNSKEVKYTPTFFWFSAWVWGTKDLKPCFWSTASLHSHHPQLSPFTECTLVHHTMVWAFIYRLWISGCTYFNSLSFFSLISQWGFPHFKQNSVRRRKQSLFLPSPVTQDSVAGWPHELHRSIFQKVLGPLLLPQQERIGLTGSDGQGAFTLSVIVPDDSKKKAQQTWSR